MICHNKESSVLSLGAYAIQSMIQLSDDFSFVCFCFRYALLTYPVHRQIRSNTQTRTALISRKKKSDETILSCKREIRSIVCGNTNGEKNKATEKNDPNETCAHSQINSRKTHSSSFNEHSHHICEIRWHSQKIRLRIGDCVCVCVFFSSSNCIRCACVRIVFICTCSVHTGMEWCDCLLFWAIRFCVRFDCPRLWITRDSISTLVHLLFVFISMTKWPGKLGLNFFPQVLLSFF